MITILHVDDDDDIRMLAELSMAMTGEITSVSAASGAEALSLLQENTPDLILLDVMMPKMSGPEFLKEMRRNPAWSAIPVVFMTARTAKADIGNLLDLDVLDVIGKPFDPLTLSAQLQSYCSGAASQDLAS